MTVNHIIFIFNMFSLLGVLAVYLYLGGIRVGIRMLTRSSFLDLQNEATKIIQ